VRVAVVIPTLDEAGSIGRVLDDLPTSLVAEVLVVDGGSKDATRAIAEGRGARVILEPRRGYGRACLTGIEQATGADVVVFLDGDYSDRPAELPRLLAPIQDGEADIVLGSRLRGDMATGAMPRHQLLGNRLAAGLIRLLYGVPLTDLGPFRAARRDVLEALALREPTYGWAVELLTRGARAGYRVVEVPVSYHPRIGVSKISGTLRGTIGAAWCILTRIVVNRLRPEPRVGDAPRPA
jgi:glycosyltransferase involved in cell wall biosynthesis